MIICQPSLVLSGHVKRAMSPVKHFHVTYEQVGSFKRPHKTVMAPGEEDALALALPTLPKYWRGGVSVFDDSGGHEDEIPLLHASI